MSADSLYPPAPLPRLFLQARDMAWAVFLNFLKRHPDTASSIEAAFMAADADGNGELDISELASVLVGLGIELDALQVRNPLQSGWAGRGGGVGVAVHYSNP